MSGPHKKQLAVVRRLRVPGPDAAWGELHEFAQTYDGSFFLSSSTGQVASLAYRPVFAAVETGDIGPELGIVWPLPAWFWARFTSRSCCRRLLSRRGETSGDMSCRLDCS